MNQMRVVGNFFQPFVAGEPVPPSGNPVPIRRNGETLDTVGSEYSRGVDFVNC